MTIIEALGLLGKILISIAKAFLSAFSILSDLTNIKTEIIAAAIGVPAILITAIRLSSYIFRKVC